MDGDGSPALEVGFLIDTGGAFNELSQLQAAMNATETQVVADAKRIEQATGGMVKLASAQAQITSFGNSASRELREVAIATNRAEKSGEGMVRQLTRQIEVFGKTSSEVRQMRAELLAIDADSRGLTELAARIRVASAEMDRLEASTGGVGVMAGRGRGSMMQFGMQLNDIGTMAALGAPPMQIFASQIGQIIQVAQMAEGGVAGFRKELAATTRTVLLATVTNPYLLALAATIGIFAAATSALTKAANEGDPVRKYAESLGLTAEEIKKLDNVTVTWGDTAKAVFQVVGNAIWEQVGSSVTAVWNLMTEWASWIFSGVKAAGNFLIGGFVGAYHAIQATWQMFPAAMGDIFYSGVNAAIVAINGLIQKSVDGVNSFIGSANGMLSQFGVQLPTLSAPQINALTNSYKGAFAAAGKAGQAEMAKYIGRDYFGEFGSAVMSQAVRNAQNRIKNQAQEKGFLDPEKAGSEKAKALSDAQKAYEAAVKAAKEYAAAQLDEAAKVGLSAKQLREYADAAAMAKAPTDELKKSIADAAAIREKAYSAQAAKDFQTNVMQPLRDELALYGLVGPARDAAALGLEKQAFLAKNMDDGIVVATARWEEYFRIKSELIAKDASAEAEVLRIRRMREEFEQMLDVAREAGDAIARSFGRIGGAVGDAISVLTEYQKRQAEIDEQQKKGEIDKITAAKRTSNLQLQGMTALAGAAKGFFKEHSAGYKAMAAAEKAFALVQLANTAVNVAAGAAKMFASLGPWAFPAVAAMVGVMAALGFASGGGGGSYEPPESNNGTGTVFGDRGAQSESIKNAIDALRDVDTVMLNYSRQMAASLKSIESNIGGFANLLVRNAESINANGGVTEGFKANAIGKVLGNIPLVGGFLKSLFGSKTTVTGSGLFGGPQSIGSILGGGFNADYYSDIQKKKKFFGITTGTSYSTQYTGADPLLENQFTLILRSFNDAIIAAAGPLGAATGEIQQRLNGFVISIGRIDLQGLTGEQIEEKLNAVFGAAADNMARAAFPFIDQFQRAGEGAFETLVRVASTIEAVGAAFDMLGQNAQNLGIAAKLGLAEQFDNIGDLTSAVDAYFTRFYTQEEQAAARTAQMASVFQSLGMAMPTSIAGFRALVEAQNLTTAAGQANYATLLKLAPAFADLQSAMEGAKSAADIASERADLQRQLLELQGDTAALRAMQLAKLDASNRELQQQIWAIQDAQAAAKAADELRKAWQSVGDSIMDEVRRIRGLNDAGGGNSFAALMGQFNASTSAARGGDMEAAKALPQLSQALLAAAADAATSRQELDRIRAQIANSLETTNGLLGPRTSVPATTNAALMNAAIASLPGTAAVNDNGADSRGIMLDEMRLEAQQLREDLISALAQIAGNTGSMKKTLDNLTASSGGDAIATVPASVTA